MFPVGFVSLLCIFFTFHILCSGSYSLTQGWAAQRDYKTDHFKSVCVQLHAALFSSYGLDIDKVALLVPLPQGLDPLQLAAVEGEARPGCQLEQGTGDRHEHQHVEAAQAHGRSP